MEKLFVGIDVSKLWLDVTLMGKSTAPQHLKVDNDKSGFTKLLNWLRKFSRSKKSWMLCMEHTGIYTQPLWYFLTEKEITYHVVPGTVIGSGLAVRRGKSDKSDSLTIARFIMRFADELSPHRIPTGMLKRLKMLFAYRDRLVKAKVMIQVPAGEAKDYAPKDSKEVRQDTGEIVEYLRKKIKRIEKIMREQIASDPDTESCYQLIVSVPGFGIVTASYLLIVTECFTLFSNSRQMACYGGIAPFEHSSGSSIRGKTRVSQKADKKLKALLSRGVSTLLQHHPPSKAYFERKTGEGKHQNLIRNNLKNKMLHTVFSVVQRKSAYDPDYPVLRC